MRPSIEAYNNMANGDNPYMWDEIREKQPGVVYRADLNQYHLLTRYCSNVVLHLKSDKCFRYAEGHESIIDCIAGEWKIESPYYVYNIDHHHDCGYVKSDNETWESAIINSVTGCANWAGKLSCCTIPKLLKYTWINNPNSDPIDEKIRIHIPNYTVTSDINVINYIPFDYLFICQSASWVPPEYIPLYDTLIYSLEKLINK